MESPKNAIIVRFDEAHQEPIKEIRTAVFTIGQGIDGSLDLDGRDPEAIHVLVRSGGMYVGTGRMLGDGHIGRLSVLEEYRGKGFGAEIVSTLVEEAKRLGMQRVFLGAQMHAVGFYRKLDFREYGQPFMEAGIEHIHMERNLEGVL